MLWACNVKLSCHHLRTTDADWARLLEHLIITLFIFQMTILLLWFHIDYFPLCLWVCVYTWEGEREWLCFRISERIGPFITTVTRRQYRVRTEMSSCSQNSPLEAVRPQPLTLVHIPYGRHTVVGSDMVPVLARDKLSRGVRGCFTIDNCSLLDTALLVESR